MHAQYRTLLDVTRVTLRRWHVRRAGLTRRWTWIDPAGQLRRSVEYPDLRDVCEQTPLNVRLIYARS